MGRPPALSPEHKAKLVLEVLAGKRSGADAARTFGISEQAVSNWRRQFLEGGRRALAGNPTGSEAAAHRVEALLRENAALKAALADMYVESRWRPLRRGPAPSRGMSRRSEFERDN